MLTKRIATGALLASGAVLSSTSNVFAIIASAVAIITFGWRVLRKLTEIVRLLRQVIALNADVRVLKANAVTAAKHLELHDRQIDALNRVVFPPNPRLEESHA